jgi:hypothetical protein
MRHGLLALCFGSLFLVAGCDELLPELEGTTTTDLAGTDAGSDLSTNVLFGHICLLSDLTSPFSCNGAGGGRRVTIEESRLEADVAADGTFSISLAGVTDTATLAVSDGANTGGESTPTLSVLSGATLAAARLDGAALPCVPAQAMTILSSEVGAGSDPSQGALLAWLVTDTGAPVAGASVAHMQGNGPLYDTGAGLSPGTVTGVSGTVAYLGLTVGTAQLVVSTNPALAVAGDTFSLPIRGGAITAMALSLPSR